MKIIRTFLLVALFLAVKQMRTSRTHRWCQGRVDVFPMFPSCLCWCCRCRIIIVITNTHLFDQCQSDNNSKQFIISAFESQAHTHAQHVWLFTNANHVRALRATTTKTTTEAAGGTCARLEIQMQRQRYRYSDAQLCPPTQ